MIVLDASVVVDLLLDIAPFSAYISERMVAEAPQLYAPHLLDVEVTQVLRRFVLRGEISASRAESALEDLLALPLRCWWLKRASLRSVCSCRCDCCCAWPATLSTACWRASSAKPRRSALI